MEWGNEESSTLICLLFFPSLRIIENHRPPFYNLYSVMINSVGLKCVNFLEKFINQLRYKNHHMYTRRRTSLVKMYELEYLTTF